MPSNIIGNNVQIPRPELVNIYDSIIDEGTKIAAFVEIGGSKIGKNCKIQAFVFIPPGTVIGDDVFIGPHVCFTNVKKPEAWVDRRDDMRGATVEYGATIGANATILPGIRIGSYAIVGAGAVVTRDVPSGWTVVGNPARALEPHE